MQYRKIKLNIKDKNMKEIKNIKANMVKKFGGPGSGPREGDTRGSYNTKGSSKGSKSKGRSKDDSPEPVGGLREKGYTIKEIQDRYDDDTDSAIEDFLRDQQSNKDAEDDLRKSGYWPKKGRPSKK